MDVIRRNTDYAIRAMVHLAENPDDGVVPVSRISQEQGVPYQLACKLLQKLNNSKLVKSSMGPNGGFKLRKKPGDVSLAEIIEAVQGPLKLNRCLLGKNVCPRQDKCSVRKKLSELQSHIDSFLQQTSLQELIKERQLAKKKAKELKRSTE